MTRSIDEKKFIFYVTSYILVVRYLIRHTFVLVFYKCKDLIVDATDVMVPIEYYEAFAVRDCAGNLCDFEK